jgi:transcription antitermination factor NusA-like protein
MSVSSHYMHVPLDEIFSEAVFVARKVFTIIAHPGTRPHLLVEPEEHRRAVGKSGVNQHLLAALAD